MSFLEMPYLFQRNGNTVLRGCPYYFVIHLLHLTPLCHEDKAGNSSSCVRHLPGLVACSTRSFSFSPRSRLYSPHFRVRTWAHRLSTFLEVTHLQRDLPKLEPRRSETVRALTIGIFWCDTPHHHHHSSRVMAVPFTFHLHLSQPVCQS